jgi:hypothetical protein
MDNRWTRAIAFVGCAGAVTAASKLAVLLGLPEAVWAAMSAVTSLVRRPRAANVRTSDPSDERSARRLHRHD